MNIGTKETMALVLGNSEIKASLDMEISGADILYLAVTGFLYFPLLFVVEKLEHSKSFTNVFSHEN